MYSYRSPSSSQRIYRNCGTRQPLLNTKGSKISRKAERKRGTENVIENRQKGTTGKHLNKCEGAPATIELEDNCKILAASVRDSESYLLTLEAL